MNEPGKTAKHSIISSNRAVRDINQSLKHLQVSQTAPSSAVQHGHDNQSQLAFERQLGLAGNISALSESVAGDRRSYPRVASTSKHVALENIRRDLQFIQSSSSSNWQQNSNGNEPLKNDYKSNSYTDLHQAYTPHMDRTIGELKSIDQQKLSLILSYGYDEVIATETLNAYPNQSLESLKDTLNSIPGSRKISKGTNNPHRVTQTQRLFGVTQYAPRSQSVMNLPTSSRSATNVVNQGASAAPMGNRYPKWSHEMPYETISRPPPPPTMEPNVYQIPSPYIQDPRTAGMVPSDPNDSSDMLNRKPNSVEFSTASRNYDFKLRDSVTLRKKSGQISNQQHRWSAEVLNKNPYDDNKRNSVEFSHKPPPPYPGFGKSSLNRISSQEGEFNTVKNTPITVIFDEKNERVNVVGGIPEGFESAPPSSPSSGQSSPRATQKDPPPYEYVAPKNPPPAFSPQSTMVRPTTVIRPIPTTKQQHIAIAQPIEPNVQQTSINQSLPPPQLPQATFHTPLPSAFKSKLSDANFVPISDIQLSTSDLGYGSDRGSPPPYPGTKKPSPAAAAPKQDNRISLNLDEIEGTVGGARSNNSVSTTSSGNESAPLRTSPVPDDVERSYSPLPICNNTYDHTMIIHPKDKKDIPQKKPAECDTFSIRLKNYTPQAYKFYMEQHVENILKLQEQRKIRRHQLEAEMRKARLPQQAQEEMRKLLNQKESNYMRLRRAKMDKSMFTKIKVVGVGAFGEVSLVKKKGTNAYYAMKTLRKSEVLRRNQVAHVKAERDILAEADNEWVVKLFYSFQNDQNLYFVMDFVPGGDLMALLIKFGIFDDVLAKFYISELVLAIESVHNLGFIHRDIKPDNILIDKNGHIKLTDFGLCTGFRWTHDSKYYQPEPEGGGHTRQYSMEPEGGWESLLNDVDCNCKSHRMQYDLLKPLQRRKLRRHMRCQAHSLVGTPNYIAPEVLMRVPYSQQCDWWSVGVIMYEMLIGQPPFLAQSPAETQFKVINWRAILNIPKNRLAKDAEDLIRKLCTDPDGRLGKDTADAIKEHPYFMGVDFQNLHQEKAPYIPTIRNPTDTSNFDPVPESMCESDSEEMEEQKHNKSSKDGPEYAFYEFTFRNFFDDGGLVNPNPDFDVHEPEEIETQKPTNKRSATKSNNSVNVPPPKVSATGGSSGASSEEKTPIYV